MSRGLFKVVDRTFLDGNRKYVAFSVVLTIIGTGAGYWLLPEDWSALRRLLAGAISGGATAFFILGSRLIGAFD